MRLRGAYAIGMCVITFDSRVKPHTAASSRFDEPSTARSHSRKNAIISASSWSRPRRCSTRPFIFMSEISEKPLLDHLVSKGEDCQRHVDAERLGRLEIDDEHKLGWLSTKNHKCA